MDACPRVWIEVCQICGEMWIAPVKYAPGPFGSMDDDRILSRWNGRWMDSAGCGSGTGDIKEEEVDRAIERDEVPVDIDWGGARPFVCIREGYWAETFRGIAGRGGAFSVIFLNKSGRVPGCDFDLVLGVCVCDWGEEAAVDTDRPEGPEGNIPDPRPISVMDDIEE